MKIDQESKVKSERTQGRVALTDARPFLSLGAAGRIVQLLEFDFEFGEGSSRSKGLPNIKIAACV